MKYIWKCNVFSYDIYETLIPTSSSPLETYGNPNKSPHLPPFPSSLTLAVGGGHPMADGGGWASCTSFFLGPSVCVIRPCPSWSGASVGTAIWSRSVCCQGPGCGSRRRLRDRTIRHGVSSLLLRSSRAPSGIRHGVISFLFIFFSLFLSFALCILIASTNFVTLCYFRAHM